MIATRRAAWRADGIGRGGHEGFTGFGDLDSRGAGARSRPDDGRAAVRFGCQPWEHPNELQQSGLSRGVQLCADLLRAAGQAATGQQITLTETLRSPPRGPSGGRHPASARAPRHRTRALSTKALKLPVRSITLLVPSRGRGRPVRKRRVPGLLTSTSAHLRYRP